MTQPRPPTHLVKINLLGGHDCRPSPQHQQWTKWIVVCASLLKLGADQPWDQPKIARTSFGEPDASQNPASESGGLQGDAAAKIVGGFWGNVCGGAAEREFDVPSPSLQRADQKSGDLQEVFEDVGQCSILSQ